MGHNPTILPLPLPCMVENKPTLPNLPVSHGNLSRSSTSIEKNRARHFKTHSKVNVKEDLPSDMTKNEMKRGSIGRSISPDSQPPVLKVEAESDFSELATCSVSPHPPSLPLQRSTEHSHSSRKSEKKKKKKKSKSKSKHRHRNDEGRHRSKSPCERDSSNSPVRSKSRKAIAGRDQKHVEKSISKSSKSKVHSSSSEIRRSKKVHEGKKKSHEKSVRVQKAHDLIRWPDNSNENKPFSFIQGDQVPKVFDERYRTLKHSEFWKGSSHINAKLDKKDSTNLDQNINKAQKRSNSRNCGKFEKSDDNRGLDGEVQTDCDTKTESDNHKGGNCRVLTKASLKEICSSSQPAYST